MGPATYAQDDKARLSLVQDDGGGGFYNNK